MEVLFSIGISFTFVWYSIETLLQETKPVVTVKHESGNGSESKLKTHARFFGQI